VAEKALHEADVRTGLEEHRCCCVAQHMRRDSAGQPGVSRSSHNCGPHASRAQRPPTLIDQKSSCPIVHGAMPPDNVLLEFSAEIRVRHENRSLSASFSEYP